MPSFGGQEDHKEADWMYTSGVPGAEMEIPDEAARKATSKHA